MMISGFWDDMDDVGQKSYRRGESIGNLYNLNTVSAKKAEFPFKTEEHPQKKNPPFFSENGGFYVTLFFRFF